MSPATYIIEYANIRTNGILITKEYLNYTGSKQSYRETKHDITLEDSHVKRGLSAQAQRRAKMALYNLIAISPQRTIFNPVTKQKQPFRLVFITLTLSADQGQYADKQIKRELLNHFIVSAKRKFGMQNYVWKSESQLNGRIHFHITTDVFIHYQELRDLWNNVQNKFGFVDLFENIQKHRNPNSTDIRSVLKIRNLPGYIAKYMSKSGKYTKPLQKYIKLEQKRQVQEERNYSKLPRNYFRNLYRTIDGKNWGCSKNLLKKNEEFILLENEDLNTINFIQDTYPDRVYNDTYFSFVRLQDDELKQVLPFNWATNYYSHIENLKLHSN